MERFYYDNLVNNNNGSSSSNFNDMFSGVSLLSLLNDHHSLSLPPLPPSLAPLPDLLSLEHNPPPPRSGEKRPRASAMGVPPGSALARQRRQRLSEKTRCLQRVLPWDTKMDMATMLEETFKYVKFLQAQLQALSTMPPSSAAESPPSDAFGGLGRLSRSQLLQVLVSSPVAQTILYSKGCCVFSVEQLGLIHSAARCRRIPSTANFLLSNPFSPF